MHPELERLNQQYLNLVADLSAGYVSQTDALRVLEGLTAVDGQGWVWSIDPYTGMFVRALPGQAPVPADEREFVPALLPVVPVEVPPHGTRPEEVSEFLHPSLRPLPPEPRARRAAGAASAAAGALTGGLLGLLRPLAGLLRGRLRTVLVAVFALVFVGAVVSRAPSAEQQGGAVTDPSSSLPTLPPPTILVPGAESAPPSDADPAPAADPAEPVPTSPPAPVVSELPSATELEALVRALASGDSTTLRAVLPAGPQERLALLPVLGATRAGFELRASGPRLVKGVATVRLTAGDPAAPVRQWTLRLRRTGSGWGVLTVTKG